jgi:predicted nucleic acid-binding protein
MIVIDTNILAAIWIRSEKTQIARNCIVKDPDWIMPTLWQSEFISVLTQYFKVNHLNKKLFINLYNDASSILENRTMNAPIDTVFDCIQASTCSSYDCEFIALAKHIGVKLLTWDKKVLSAFPDIAIKPEDFLA